MHPVRKTLINRFEEQLTKSYLSHCNEHSLEESRDVFLDFLIDRGLIPSTQIKRFTILQMFQEQHIGKNGKTEIVRKLADLFNLSERHVWSILKYEEQLKRDK